MVTNSVAGKPGFSGKADAEGPTAGFDPVIGKVQKRKKFIPSYLLVGLGQDVGLQDPEIRLILDCILIIQHHKY